MDAEAESLDALVGAYRREIVLSGCNTWTMLPLIEARLTPLILMHNARFAGSVTFEDVRDIAHAPAHPLEWLLAAKEGEGEGYGR